MSRVYVASSWRCPWQPDVVEALRTVGHAVYDFKQPLGPGSRGFHWSECGINSQGENVSRYLTGLAHPIAQEGFNRDFGAMQWADACVLVLPCGRSAHIEAGWFIGKGKPTAILLYEDPVTPDLMYLMADLITPLCSEVIDWLQQLQEKAVAP